MSGNPVIGTVVANFAVEGPDHVTPLYCNGQIVGQPKKRECRQNVRKMSKKCLKMAKNCPEGLKTQYSDMFWTIFAYLVDAFVW